MAKIWFQKKTVIYQMSLPIPKSYQIIYFLNALTFYRHIKGNEKEAMDDNCGIPFLGSFSIFFLFAMEMQPWRLLSHSWRPLQVVDPSVSSMVMEEASKASPKHEGAKLNDPGYIVSSTCATTSVKAFKRVRLAKQTLTTREHCGNHGLSLKG